MIHIDEKDEFNYHFDMAVETDSYSFLQFEMPARGLLQDFSPLKTRRIL